MNAVVQFQEPRLPYHDAINTRFGVDKTAWKALTEAVFPTARSIDSVVMALAYCKARHLDIFKRPVHIVPMWSAAQGKEIETVWPGVSEIRTTAFRTGQFAGIDSAEFGPQITRHFSGTNRRKESREIEVTFPEWCQITVWRVLAGQRCAFVGPKVYWLESYARWSGTDVPNEMWAKRPVGQIEKCAEAAAIRRAFPEEVGNDYAAEEMEGQGLLNDLEPVQERHQVQSRRAPAPPAPEAPAIEHKPVLEMEPVRQEEAAQVTRRAPPPPQTSAGPAQPSEATAEDATDFESIRKRFKEAAVAAQDREELGAAWDRIVEPHWKGMFPPDRAELLTITREREAELPFDD